MQLAMEEDELRSLRITSQAHRGAFSPSKNSFLPTLQEHAQERIQQLNKRDRQQRSSRGGRFEANGAVEKERKGSKGDEGTEDYGLISEISADLLDSIKQDFVEKNNALDLEDFTQAMLRNLLGTQLGEVPGTTTSRDPLSSSSIVNHYSSSSSDQKAARCVAAIVDLFERVDVHSEEFITWEQVSNYLIKLGASGHDEFTVDNIKTYELAQVDGMIKTETSVEKLVYLEQIDSLVVMQRESRKFKLYDPKRCTLKNEVVGHRGTVINCCFVDAFSQIATTSADMTVCLWDSVNLGLRNRMSTKEVQLCLCWDENSKSLFSGAIDGALSRWDLQHMTLSDTRKGAHKGAINDLLAISDINLLASAADDGNILMWDTASMRQKKTFKGHKKGAFSLAYSMDYHCLLTAGLDQEALVWNPYVQSMPIFRLRGQHTHALCGVEVVPGTPQIVTADVTGTFKMWDMRNFRCVQTFGEGKTASKIGELNSFCAIPQHRRLAAGAHGVTMYDYMDEWGSEHVTDSGGVTDALYRPGRGFFLHR
jgi:WD40 repeat protein